MMEYVIADIHGAYKALLECLNLSGFDYKYDHLIVLGDICDGHQFVKQCIAELLKIKHLTLIKGNHDDWAVSWMNSGFEFPGWVHQGGYYTMKSYDFDFESVPESHKAFLTSALPYYESNHNVFVHGGFNPALPIKDQEIDFIMWDRDLCQYAQDNLIPNYSKVFVGHTAVQLLYGKDYTFPAFHNNLVMLDTGVGWIGKLTIMNTKTLQYWQSSIYRQNDENNI